MSDLADHDAIALSIIFPLANLGEFVLDAIAYFEAELEVSFEVLIINNSRDELSNAEILNYLYDQGYQVFKSSDTTSLSQVLNVAIEHATGQYILPILTADPVLAFGIFDAVYILNHYPEVGIVYSSSFSPNLLEDWRFLEDGQGIFSLFRKEVWQVWSQEHLKVDGEQNYFWDFWLNAVDQGWLFYDLPYLLDESLKFQGLSGLALKKNDFILMTNVLKSKLEDVTEKKQKAQFNPKVKSLNLGIEIREPPLVSICIPTYNGERFIGEAISNALSQTYPAIEVIISDDGSTDRTLAIANYFKDHTSINLFIFDHQQYGLSENCNFSVLKSKGEYIKFLFQDDLLHPQCIEKMVDLAQKDDEIGLIFSPRDIIFANPAETDPDLIGIFRDFSDLHLAWANLKPIQWGDELLRNPNLFYHPINKIGEPTTVLLRRGVFDKVGFFDSQLNQLMDLDLWWRVCGYFKVGFIEETLSYFRLHSQQQTYHNIQNLQANDFYFYYKVYQNPIYHFLTPKQRYEALLIYTITLNDKYLKSNHDKIDLISQYRQLRREIATFFLSLSNAEALLKYEGVLGTIHKILSQSKMMKEPLNAEEKRFLQNLNEQLSNTVSNSETIRYLMVIMLYQTASEVAFDLKLDRIPSQSLKIIRRWLKQKN